MTLYVCWEAKTFHIITSICYVAAFFFVASISYETYLYCKRRPRPANDLNETLMV